MSKPGSLKASLQKKGRETAPAHPAAAATLAAAAGEPETRRLNVNVPADLYDQFRAKVDADGRSLTWVVNQWVREYVGSE